MIRAITLNRPSRCNADAQASAQPAPPLVSGGMSPYFKLKMKELFCRRARSIALGLSVVAVLLGLTAQTAQAKAAKMLDLADTVAANPILTKFSLMVQYSELGTFLSSRGPFTLFAPTDSAFSRLPPGTLEALLRPENKVRLQDIILFYVISGKKLSAKDLLTATNLISCQGAPLPVKKSRSGAQLVLKAKIVHADIRCENGVIHEIDTLLMPPESALPPLAPPAASTPPANPAATTNAPSASTPNPPANTNAVPTAPATTLQ